MKIILKISLLLQILVVVIGLLIAVAFSTLFERRLLGTAQLRVGPLTYGLGGISQAFNDAIKLLFKETILPLISKNKIFILAPILSFFLTLICWLVIPGFFQFSLLDHNLALLFLLAISSLGIYGILGAGWASNSKYSLLGSLRATSQLVSYEIALALLLLSPLLFCAILNFKAILITQIEVMFATIFFVNFGLFLITILSEICRAPFDIPEAESELVSGFNTEFSSITFALFFLAEYAHVIIGGFQLVIFWLGGLSILPISIVFILGIRACYPRIRYDHLQQFSWKTLLPWSFGAYIIFQSFSSV